VKRILVISALAAASMVLISETAAAAPACPISYGSADSAKPNKLYLYFPTAADPLFPEFSVGTTPTSPLAAFDVAALTSYTGTVAALRNAIHDVVVDDHCEFNAQVLQTTTAPPTTFARRNIIGIGTDTADAYGQAENVDTGDATLVDRARVWAGTYQTDEGGAGGALNGANSTLARWARAIGGTTAHEAGHNYGVSHTDGANVAGGEDALTRHLMPRGALLTGEQRAGFRRHHNDRAMSLLASNIGLSIQTMHNWDLDNPNAGNARRLRMEFLHPNSSVIMSWAYTGALSPWNTPTVSASLGTTTFKGTTYNRFRIEWSTAKAWSGGAAGTVPGGADFHIGATFSGTDFNQPDAIIITKIELLDAAGTPLALQPRLVGYDAGTLDAADGSMDIRFFNIGAANLIIENLVVRELPRVLSIDAMVPGPTRIFDWRRHRFAPWPESTRLILRQSRPLKRGATLPVTVARLRQRRHILERIDPATCDLTDNRNSKPDAKSCKGGINIDLFPATTLYLTATVLQPSVRHWDRKLRRYVTGPVRRKLFLQFGGRHPDLNRNRRDDAVDIATGRSKDANRDGVPDEAQRRRFDLRLLRVM
jgi:hypothetical protein